MESTEYEYIKRQIRNNIGVDLNCYKAPQMQRRLNTYLARSGYSNWPDFFKARQNDSTTLNNLRDYLTINVSSFFRDTDKYKYLQQKIVPLLLNQRRTLRIWSAGCSKGQEAYTLAMSLETVCGMANRHKILATDLDNSAINHAKKGGPYTREDVANVPQQLLGRFFNNIDGEYWVKTKRLRNINFRVHNLLADRYESDFDLIVCRNVVIYFQSDAKNKVYRNFYQALCPEGVLFVGGTEIVPKSANLDFSPLGISFYQRPQIKA